MSSTTCSLNDSTSSLMTKPATQGTFRLKYCPDSEWDFALETPFEPIDVELVLPHYRAHGQPISHRLNAFIASNSEPVRVKCCRQVRRSKFYMEIQANTSDVTVWLPSDFRGHISYSSTKASFSAGFANRIMQNARINESSDRDDKDSELEEDEVIVHTHGRISFRMWDVLTATPEKPAKESFKRIFGRGKKAPETTIDWDFLLDG